VAAILGALLLALAVASALIPDFPRRTNWGFGPELECRAFRGGEPICFPR
jgi:hypothetical protein